MRAARNHELRTYRERIQRKAGEVRARGIEAFLSGVESAKKHHARLARTEPWEVISWYMMPEEVQRMAGSVARAWFQQNTARGGPGMDDMQHFRASYEHQYPGDASVIEYNVHVVGTSSGLLQSRTASRRVIE